MSAPNYWGFRVNWRDEKALEFLKNEINEGRLRQGWGYDESQDLRKNPTDKGAKANMPILRKVRKGDYLLIPHVPTYSFVTIVKAVEDFKICYDFQINPVHKDYGHIFLVERIKKFRRNNNNVHADIRTSLRNPMRFWCMNRYGEKIQEIIDTDESLLKTTTQGEELALDNLKEAIRLTLNEETLKQNLNRLFEQSFQSTEWEFALRKILEILLPHCFVKRVGGKQEKEHGCDLAVFIPSIERERQYVIGIQIKDYQGEVDPNVIDQISKAEYWTEDAENGCVLIDKYIFVIDSTKDKNEKLENCVKDNGIHVLYRDDILELLSRAAKIQMSNNL